MKVLVHSVDVTARLELSARELELLVNLLSYDLKPMVERVCPNSYQGGVSVAEMTEFLTNLKGKAKDTKNYINTIAKQGLIRG